MKTPEWWQQVLLDNKTSISGHRGGGRSKGEARQSGEAEKEEEIPWSPRDVILFKDNGCEVDACQLGNAFGPDFYSSLSSDHAI